MAIETEVEVLKSVVNKLDQSLEKISQVSDDIGKLLAVHDAKITQLVKESDIRTDDVNARVTVLEVWRWYILGGVAVLLFLFSNLNTFSKLFN